jgi:hypothetical protein
LRVAPAGPWVIKVGRVGPLFGGWVVGQGNEGGSKNARPSGHKFGRECAPVTDCTGSPELLKEPTKFCSLQAILSCIYEKKRLIFCAAFKIESIQIAVTRADS